MALTLLRHTTPDVEPGICYGRTDLDVAPTFEAEATAVCAALPAVAHIVTSPLLRCRKLANFLADRLHLSVDQDPRLVEMDFGAWEGRPWSAISRAQIDAWAEDFLHARPHGGESVALLQARTVAALTHWGAGPTPTLIVTHSGVIRAALAAGETADHFNAKVDYGGLVTLPRGRPRQGPSQGDPCTR